jgi:hypothetical protein
MVDARAGVSEGFIEIKLQNGGDVETNCWLILKLFRNSVSTAYYIDYNAENKEKITVTGL